MAATIRRWGLTVALVLAVLPFVVAVAMAVHDNWHPLGDDAAIATLSHDVLSSRTPLVGMPSTVAGANADANHAHHPGPLLFWTLAVPERAAGSAPIGLLIGAALVNAISVVLIGWFTARVAGNAAGIGAITLAFVLAWALGRQIVVDVWNPYLAVFPLLALLVLTWATLAGHLRALWLVAVLASFVAQAHLLYLPLAITMGLVATAGVAYTLTRRARAGASWRRDTLVVGGGAFVILVVAWMLPLADQVLHSPGNIVAIERSVRANQTQAVGVSYALRTIVQSIGVLPLFARQGTSYTLVGRSWGELGALRVLSAVIVLGVLAAGTVVAIRRRDRVGAAAALVALVALVVAGVTVARLPTQPIDVARYRLLQLWVTGAFVWFTAILLVVRALPTRVRTAPAFTIAAGVAAAFVLVAVPITIASTNSDNRDDPRMYAATAALAHDAAPDLQKGTSYTIAADPGLLAVDVQYGLLRELARRGFDMKVAPDDSYLARAHTAPPDARRLVLRAGQAEVDTPPAGGKLIASASEVTAADRARLPGIDDALRTYLRDPAIVTDRGRASGDPRLAALADPNRDPLRLVHNGDLTHLWADHLLRSNVFLSSQFRAYSGAHQAADSLVYALYAMPAG